MKGIEGLTLGRYELRRRIAQGGMAEVYLGYDRRVRRQVAIKVLYGRDEPFVRRFEREALAVGALSHNHILPLYDFGEQRPWYYLVMPYIDSGTLREYLLKRKRLTLEEAASIIDQIASALQHAHDHRVVHRDVKPSNILLRSDGYAYLVDFGLAKAMSEAESLTSAGAMIGTPEYMAPEQSNGINDYRSDIYSLGVILYQMLTGRVPFTAESPVAISLKHIQVMPTPPRELNSEIPESVEEVILKAMAKDPNDRYQDAQAFSAAYWKALQREQSQATIAENSTSSKEEAENETADETQKSQQAPSAITELIQQAERNLAHPPITPLLFPSGEKSEPTRPSSHSGMRSKKRRTSIALVALTCLLIIAIALPLVFTWQTVQGQQGRSVQSPQTLVSQQGNIDMTATAIAQAQATLAAQARAQATAGITSSIGAGKVLYSYDMLSPGGGWIDDGSQCYFSPEGYHVRTYSAHTAAWCYSNQQQYADAVITAQAQLLQGDVYGLIFRLSPESRAFYVLELNKQGQYRFIRALGNNPLNWVTLIDWTPSNAILSGYGQTNTFLIVATGSNFRLYINKQLILTNYTDTNYSNGLIGFLVGGDSPGGTEAVFSNVWVFQK